MNVTCPPVTGSPALLAVAATTNGLAKAAAAAVLWLSLLATLRVRSPRLEGVSVLRDLSTLGRWRGECCRPRRRWPGTGQQGHGHHLRSTVVAKRAQRADCPRYCGRERQRFGLLDQTVVGRHGAPNVHRFPATIIVERCRGHHSTR